jgi:hypothetical protein
MPFLIDDDYDVQSRQELLAVVATSSTSRQSAELMAQATITESINKRFDTTAIFSAVGDSRSIIVIMYMIDITLYILHSKTATRAMPKVREERFTAAKEWLKLIRDGKINPDLPELVTQDVDTYDNHHEPGHPGWDSYRGFDNELDENYFGSAGSNKKRYRGW